MLLMAGTAFGQESAWAALKLEKEGIIEGSLKENKAKYELKAKHVDPQLVKGLVSGTEGTNNSPGTAAPLTLDVPIQDTIDAQGEQDWYIVYVPNAGKVTAVLDTVSNSAIDYDLHMFKYDEATGTLVNQIDSMYGPAHYEQLSTVADAGSYYFVAVDSYQGFDAVNPYTLGVMYSDLPDDQEPDDNPWQAKLQTGAFTKTGNLDNVFDEDWIKLTIAQGNRFTFNLNNPAGTVQYRANIYNANLAAVGSVSNNGTVTYQLTAGTYYLNVATLNAVEPVTPYRLSMSAAAASISLTDVMTDSGNGGYIDYGSGYKWRVRYFATFVGQMKDINGNPAPNVPVSIQVNTPQTYQSVSTASGTTDTFGNFAVTVNLPHARGVYTWYGYASIHYYDIASATISSTLVQGTVPLYHYGFSTYRPH